MYLEYFRSYFLVVAVLMSTFKNKNSLRTIEAQIVQKIKNNAARLKVTGSYKKSVYWMKDEQTIQKPCCLVLRG